MLKVLEAIEFTKIFTKGGRTEPWLLQVEVEGERKPYVVKLFETDEVDNENTVAREVFGAILAGEFNLSVPEPALINFSKDFISTLPEKIKDLVLLRDHRMKFGSSYCHNVMLLKPDLPAKQIKNFDLDIPVIYGFDTMINNKDRGRYKTNILVSTIDNNYFIFDHERAFKRIKQMEDEVNNSMFTETLKNHVLWKYLHSQRDKSQLFDDFQFYLNVLSPNVLDEYNNQLRDYNVHSNDLEGLKSYLYGLKQKSDWFVKVLKHSIAQ